jgi:hypothetical protein
MKNDRGDFDPNLNMDEAERQLNTHSQLCPFDHIHELNQISMANLFSS